MRLLRSERRVQLRKSIRTEQRIGNEIPGAKRRLLVACLAVASLYLPYHAFAQFSDPRTYINTATGTNQLELGCAYARANASIDSSLIITGAKFNLNQGMIDYTHYFGFLHRLTWVEAAVPVAGLSGSITGSSIQGTVVGAGDSSYALGMLLKGGTALNAPEFENYKPTTTFGMSLTVTAPTGLYRSNKILNLGSDRWSFKPEVALSHPFGPEQKWELDVYANSYFYTDNLSYHGREILWQEPLPAVEGHISYSLTDSLWASLDTRYSFRGTTFLNGLTQNNPQRNFILGTELNVSLNTRHSLVLEFARALVHRNGPALAGFGVKYDYTWGQ